VFSYLKGYTFAIAHTGDLEVGEGKLTRLQITAVSMGSMDRPWEAHVGLKVSVVLQPLHSVALQNAG
jgi:hypothetical protein